MTPRNQASESADRQEKSPSATEREAHRDRSLLWLSENVDRDFPPDVQRAFQRARRVEWLNVILTVLSVALIGSVLGSSQSMKSAWVEDATSLIPPICALLALRFERLRANRHHPFGYYGANVGAFALASGAILLVGLLLLWDSGAKLIAREHVSIETVTLLGRDVWLGWLMLVALVVTGAWPIVVSRFQREAARAIFDRPIFADALMNKAQWLSSGSALVGVLLAGFGVWWGDALAGVVISLDIVHDGYTHLRQAASDIMDRAPALFEKERLDPLVGRMTSAAREVDGVADCEVLARENGRFLFAHLLVHPLGNSLPIVVASRVREAVNNLSWRVIYVGVEVVDTERLEAVRKALRRQ
jgi:cation diffusion facilitator family transporter